MFGILFIQNIESQSNNIHRFYKMVNIELCVIKANEIY